MDHLLSMEISAVPCGIDGISLVKTHALFSFEGVSPSDSITSSTGWMIENVIEN